MIMYPLLIALGLYAVPMLAANQADELVQFAHERKEYYRKKYPTMTDRVIGARVAQDVEKKRFGVQKSVKAKEDHNVNAVVFPEYDTDFADQYSEQENVAVRQKQPKMVDVAAGVQEAESVLEGLQPEQPQEQYADAQIQPSAQEMIFAAQDKYDAAQVQQERQAYQDAARKSEQAVQVAEQKREHEQALAEQREAQERIEYYQAQAQKAAAQHEQEQQEALEQMNARALHAQVLTIEQENNATRQQQEQEEQALADYKREQQAHAIHASVDAAHDEYYKQYEQSNASVVPSATTSNAVKTVPAQAYEVVVHQPQQSQQAITAVEQGQHVYINVADDASLSAKPVRGKGKIRVNNYPVVRINEPVDIQIDAHEGTVNYHVVGEQGIFKSYLAAYLNAYKDKPKTTVAKTAAAMGLGSLMVYGLYKASKWFYKNYWPVLIANLQGKQGSKPVKPYGVHVKPQKAHR